MESLLLKAKSNTQVLIFLLSLFVITRILLYFAGFLGMNLFPNYQIPPDYAVVQEHILHQASSRSRRIFHS